MTGSRRKVGRYELFGAIASGGMATVHLARLQGPIGFSRTVAVKQLHPRFAGDAHVYEMLVDEARIAGRIQHPNVLSTLDVVSEGKELFLVMDYVAGESLSHLMRQLAKQQERMPLPVVASIAASALYGLHAAHESKNQRGEHLRIVHRDVSPQNIMVGVDGVTRVLDFGIAKATQRIQRSTLSGQVKGKMGYMAPEQIAGEEVDRRTDLWAAAVVLWEMLTGKRLFGGGDPTQAILRIVRGDYPRPSGIASDVPAALDELVMRCLARDPAERMQTAREMALAIEQAVSPATHREVGELVERVAGAALGKRATLVSELELDATTDLDATGGVESAATGAPGAPGSTAPSSSSASVSTSSSQGSSEGPGKPRAKALWMGAAAVLIAIGVALAVPWAMAEPPESVATDAAESGPAERATAAEEAAPPVAPTTPASVEPTGRAEGAGNDDPAPALSAPAAPVAVQAPAQPKAPPIAPAAAPAIVAPAPPSAAPPPPSPCTPPFYFERVGDNLIKKWKPECL